MARKLEGPEQFDGAIMPDSDLKDNLLSYGDADLDRMTLQGLECLLEKSRAQKLSSFSRRVQFAISRKKSAGKQPAIATKATGKVGKESTPAPVSAPTPEPVQATPHTRETRGQTDRAKSIMAEVETEQQKAQALPPTEQPDSRQTADSKPTTGKQPIEPFNFLSVADIMAMPDIEWAINGWFAMNQLTIIYGESGAGKTFFMLDLLARLRLGKPWHGIKTKPFSDYVYFCLESSGGLKQRLKAYNKENGAPYPEMKIWPKNFNLIDESERLIVSVPERALVVIDTLSAATTGYDDSSNEDMGKAIAIGYQLIQERKATVFFVHHTGKDASKGARGGYVLKANVDNVWRLEKSGSSKVKVVGEKIKEGDSGNHVFKAFELAVWHVGETPDGEQITSCAVREVNENDLPDKPKLKATPDRKNALDTLWEIYRENEQKPVHLDTWRPTFYKVSAGSSDSAKEKAFERARKALADSGIIEVGGYFYKPLQEFI